LVDSQCPAGLSCAPLTVGDDSTSFHECRELGSTASARCDNDADCVSNRYCNADGVCAADAAEDAACTVDGQCPEGTYCNDTTLVCTAYTLRGSLCTRALTTRAGEYQSEQCEPAAVGCIYDETDLQLECSSAKNDEGEVCLVDYDCDSNMCEEATEAAVEMTCVVGAGVGDACDAVTTTGIALRCAPGLACIDGECVEQLLPGGDCETEAGGAADTVICANSSCAERWDEPGAFMCTDTAVPESAGGTGLTCDGGE
jgi:hypothetical protein